MNLMQSIRDNAKLHSKRIVLAEGTEERTLKAADIILKEELAQIILLGNLAEIERKSKAFGLTNIGKARVIDPVSHAEKEEYTQMLYNIRKSKGLTMEQAGKLVEDPLYLDKVDPLLTYQPVPSLTPCSF